MNTSLKVGIFVSMNLHAGMVMYYVHRASTQMVEKKLTSVNVSLVRIPAEDDFESPREVHRGNAGEDDVSSPLHREIFFRKTFDSLKNVDTPFIPHSVLAKKLVEELPVSTPLHKREVRGEPKSHTWSHKKESPTEVSTRKQRSLPPSELHISRGSLEPPRKASPRMNKNKPPVYPRTARLQGLEGVVHIGVLVSARGIVERVWIESSSGHAVLDVAARKAVKAWRFNPALNGRGEATRSTVTIPVVFQLR